MSSTFVTVSELIDRLQKFPSNMLVAVDQPVHKGEEYEGCLDGPSVFEVIKVRDARSGFNHDYSGEHDWEVLRISSVDLDDLPLRYDVYHEDYGVPYMTRMGH